MGAPLMKASRSRWTIRQGAYDASKARASLAVLEAIAGGLDAVIVCPTAVAGPYDFHGSETGRAIQLYMRPGLKFLVDGAYDFVDVRDVARGCILAACQGQKRRDLYPGRRADDPRRGGSNCLGSNGHVAASLEGSHRAGLFCRKLDAALYRCNRSPALSSPVIRWMPSGAIPGSAMKRRAGNWAIQPRPARTAILDAVRWIQAGTARVFLISEINREGRKSDLETV